MDQFFAILDVVDDLVWGYLGVAAIVLLGAYFSIRSGFAQIRCFPAVCRHFFSFIREQGQPTHGVHPLRAFFASVGGCIGIGNVVGVCTAVQIGGPGALFWIWITGLFGMLLKYAEVYIGVQHRVLNDRNSFDGGPMYYLQAAFKNKILAYLVCALLCIYGVEVFMFNVITDSIGDNLGVSQGWVAAVLLPLVILAALGGVDRVGQICSYIIPAFLLIFTLMCFWVFWLNLAQLPLACLTVLRGAFTGHAAVGAFVGSSFLLTLSQGVRRACYTGDIGVGYASVITSETSAPQPERQAALSIFGIFIDTFLICTFTLLLVLVTGAWKEDISATRLVQEILSAYFPYMWLFMPLLIFMLGYSSMIAFLVVGFKCARFLLPQYGERLYLVYAALALVASLWINPLQAQTIMSVTGALLLIGNLAGIYRLRKHVHFNI